MGAPYSFDLPGYKKGCITFKADSTAMSTSVGGDHPSFPKKVEVGFIASPTNIQEQRSNSMQIDKTMAGWFVSRTGPGIGSLTLAGYLIDSMDSPERLDFLNAYSSYAEDNLNSYLEYFNVYKQTIEIEGMEYTGFIQNLSLNKSNISPFVYNFTINFAFIDSVQNFTGHSTSSSDTQSHTKISITRSIGGSNEVSERKVYNFNSVDNADKLTRSINESVSTANEARNIVSAKSNTNVASVSKSTVSAISSRTLGILLGEKGVD